MAEQSGSFDQRALLAALVEGSDDAIVSKSLDGIINSWNPAAERIFGHTAAEAIGKPISLIVPPELTEQEQQILAQVRQGERVDHLETQRLVKVLGDGDLGSVTLEVSAHRFSGSAKDKIIAAGGSATEL